MVWKLLLTLLVVFRCILSLHGTFTIHVHPTRGQDSKDCLTDNNTTNPCATLRYALKHAKKSSEVVLEDIVHSINTALVISDINDLSLVGKSYNTVSIVDCSQGTNAGLKFENVSNLVLSRLQFQNCGSFSPSTSRISLKAMAKFRAAVYVINTTNATFKSINIVDSNGVGLVLFDVDGYVSILDSNFTGNSVSKEEWLVYNGGGGLYIEYTYCTPGLVNCDFRSNLYGNDSVYKISRSRFINNHATTPPQHSSSIFAHQEKTTSRHFGAGGGLLVLIKGNSYNNKIFVMNCHFEHNSAGFGGASLINLQDFVRGNVIHFVNCTVINNHANFGGGGVAAGILFYELDAIFANGVHFHGVYFFNNSSPTGGGAYFFISRTKSSELAENSISFSNCCWRSNNATVGAAILLAPDAFNVLTDGYLPVPVFKNCSFESNRITPLITGNNIKQPAVGALFSSTFTINITTNVTFVENEGTAISITAGSINILENGTLKFKNNTGIYGGALALLEFASVRLFSGSGLKFINNHATEKGGAIYATAQDELDFYFSRSCFIHYEDVTVTAADWDVHVEFIDNYAGPHQLDITQGARGNSVYSETILPCLLASDTTGEQNIYNAFPHEEGDPFIFIEKCHGNFCGIATAPATLEVSSNQFDSNGVLKLSPGEKHNLSIVAKDDLNNTVSAVITASASPPEIAAIDSASLYITDNMVQVNGKIGTSFILTFHTVGRKQISVVVNATFVDCPSGFVYDQNEQKCVCSAATPNQQYLGIIRCSTRRFESYQTKGYWAGCNQNGALLTARCPLGYCRKDENTTYNTNSLPKTCQGLDQVICGVRNRSGLLCGECIPNHTVFFHSEQYNCHICKLGHIGWLFYVLSELLPVTLVFLTVVLFNVHLTSGLWNGIILYAQIIDFIEASSLLSFNHPKGVSILTSIYHFIYSMFNLDFFKFEDDLSFCLWNGATVMDVLAFKYVTSAYTIVLLSILLLVFKYPCCHDNCQNVRARCQTLVKRSYRNDWVVHGISAFLVLSYAQCVKVSFQILSSIQLYGEEKTPVKTVVILNGNIEFLSPEHLRYALPAMFVLTMTTLPLILLMMYPNGQQLFTLCVGEKNIDNIQQCCSVPLCSCIRQTTRITRFKPLFDSFQGSFKDNFRFFASLLFVYRFLASMICAVSLNPVSLYVSIEVLIILMLGLHAWAQPYQRRFYNLLDAFLYTNLAIVNGLSLFNYYWVNNPTVSNFEIVHITKAVQLTLIFLPLVYIFLMWLLFGLTLCSMKTRRCLRKINRYIPLFKLSPQEIQEELNSGETIPFDEMCLPYRMFNDSSDHEDQHF